MAGRTSSSTTSSKSPAASNEPIRPRLAVNSTCDVDWVRGFPHRPRRTHHLGTSDPGDLVVTVHGRPGGSITSQILLLHLAEPSDASARVRCSQ